MKNSTIRYVLGIDPSGNFIEGKGITGWCIFDVQLDKVIEVGSIRAAQAAIQEGHWQSHIELLNYFVKKYVDGDNIAVSIEDYVLYSNSVKSQINSAMETCQLLGIIKMNCWHRCLPLYIRTASQVKRRWADSILCHKNYIFKAGSSYFVTCRDKLLCDHERDAIRHAVHCATFELKEEQNERSK